MNRKLPILAGAAMLLVAALIVFAPALHGGLLWDDSAHMTPPDMVSLHGLWRIWFEVGATQQYYPLLYSAFWFEHHFWGDATFGYHLINMVEHAAAATLVWVILRRLKIPGAFFAALLFAVHPVNVETVAWITEQKNTLSILFYLGAMWCYLEFDERRGRGWYAAAVGHFVLGLLTKTVIATLPAALLVIFWWRRGKLEWKRDVAPTLPLFGLALLGGLVTAWLEYTMVGAHGADFQLTLIERALLAGHVVWFYLGSLAWPTNVMFYYPRWTVDASEAVQWLFPLGMLLLLGALWRIRGRTRAPLAAMLFFIGSLFPVIGFMNVYPFKFSYVADHFQYLPALGIVTLFAGTVFTLRARLGGGGEASGRCRVCPGYRGAGNPLDPAKSPLW